MIALTGEEERLLRAYRECLDVKPPLVNVVRQAVREFLDRRVQNPDIRKRWLEQLKQQRNFRLHK
jgi:hypothetical protein